MTVGSRATSGKEASGRSSITTGTADGVLSGDEVGVGQQRTTAWDTADHRPNQFERNISWTEAGFLNLDHNRDGRLTTNEWHYDLETFRRIDRNRDNAVSPSEFLGRQWDDDRNDSFDDLDVNNNGRVERSEWHGGLGNSAGSIATTTAS
jgi:hypothetical protein